MIDGVEVDAAAVQTNIVFLRLAEGRLSTGELVAELAAEGVHVAEMRPGRIRCVTHADVDATDVDQLVTVFADVLASSDRSARGTARSR